MCGPRTRCSSSCWRGTGSRLRCGGGASPANCAASSRATAHAARARRARRHRHESGPQAASDHHAADPGRGRSRDGAFGVRAAKEHDLPVFAFRGRRRQGAGRPSVPAGRHRQGRQRASCARFADHRLRDHRPLPEHPGDLHRHPARPVPRRPEHHHHGFDERRQVRRDPSAREARLDIHAAAGRAGDREGQGRASHSTGRGARGLAMNPELGQVALILALLLSGLQCVLPIVGAWRGSRPLMATARSLAIGQFVFVALAFGILMWSFWIDDFSVAYVAQNSNLALPWFYKLSAVWGAHEGSLLLWMLILNGWTLALVVFGGKLPEAFFSRVIGVLGFVAFGFLLYMITTSNPFLRQFPIPANGADLNPVLQDPGLVFHPPTLYMGYVGFSVAFAFAIASL